MAEKEVEKLRQTHENDRHWQLRRQFLLNNWGLYEEKQLVSLSMVWSNVYFDGCVYQPELMARVKEMSAGIDMSMDSTSDS